MDAYAIMVITEVRERLAGEGSVAERQSKLVIHLKVPEWGCSSAGSSAVFAWQRSRVQIPSAPRVQQYGHVSYDECAIII